MRKLFGVMLIVSVFGCQSNKPPTPDAQADALIKHMTLSEKISLIGGDNDEFSTHAIPRLGITKLTMADGPQGIRNYPPSCSFPCGAALAATWDTQLAQSYGKAMGLEARARGVNFVLGPGMNICRVPVNGRNFEYFGEDPFLAGKIAANWVRAAQDQGIVTTIKHYAANNQEWNRNTVDVIVDERTLQEIYLPAFRRAVQEGGAGAVMAAYDRVNGAYCAENNLLLNRILKTEWNFQGIVMSDWGACHSTDSLARGLDLEMGKAVFFKEEKIKQALDAGTLHESDIDSADHRILRTAIATGFFNRPQSRPDLPWDSKDSDRAALDIARGAIVLLKNEQNTLPLARASVHHIAVFGPNAEDTPTGGGGSGAVKPFRSISFLQGIRNLAGPNVDVTYTPMPPVDDKTFETFPNVLTAANGQPGFVLNAKVEGAGPEVDLPQTIVQSINVSLKPGDVPFGVPSGRDASYTWTGVIMPPEDGEWEIVSKLWGRVTLDGKPLSSATGTIVHLKKNTPVSIKVEASARAKSKRSGFIKVSMRPVVMPDITAAKSADAVIVCTGLNGQSEHEGADRDFDLSEIQQRLISSLEAANPKTIVVLNGGAGIGMQSWFDATPAILQAWYIGQEGGTALGEVLFGDVNPSGRLPSTFDRKFEDNPAYPNYPGKTVPDQDYPVEHYSEGIFIGYRGYDKNHTDPLFPFGYGLSYSTFDFANMKLENSGDGVKVSLDVTNTSHVAGAEVVQIYVGQQNCSIERPVRELKGFTKVPLNPGQTQRVEIILPRDSFSFWSPVKKDWTIEPGLFTIEAATSERDIKCKDTISIN